MEETATVYRSPVGELICSFQDGVLVGLDICRTSAGMTAAPGSLLAKAFLRQLDHYFRGVSRSFSQTVCFNLGTDFERQVWLTLLSIPFGETRSYQWVAKQLGRPGAARAVGRAVGKNPLLLIVPCHRVIASDGSVGGFSAGIHVKRWLLAHEAAVVRRLSPATQARIPERG